MQALKRLIHEIHRRSIWQVVAIYLAASWAVLEAVQGLTDATGLPNWLPPLAVALLLIGLPIVVATAFVQEGAPGRAVREAGPGPDPASSADSHRVARTASLFTWRNAILGGLAATALWGVVATVWLVQGGVAGGTLPPAPGPESHPAAAERPLDALPAIAVLPFTNMSTDQDFAFFADGIHEDILTNLSKIEGLLVLSRTSMLRYRDTDKSVPEIGAEVGAQAILEGSVRRAGNAVRITTQLIDARTDTHLWAATYDRDLDDVFAVQTDIAREVTAALDATLTPVEEQRIASGAAADLTAYDLYLQGRQHYSAYARDENERAMQLFKRAIDLDPKYGLAWAGLADAYAQYVSAWSAGLEWADSAVAAARTAVELAPQRAEAHKALGLALSTQSRDEEAVAAYKRALELDPNNSHAANNIGGILGDLGRLDEAVPWILLAERLDKGDPIQYRNLVVDYAQLGLPDLARPWMEKLRSVEAPRGMSEFAEFILAWGEGRVEDYVALAERYVAAEPTDAGAHLAAAVWCLFADDLERSEKYARDGIRLSAADRSPTSYKLATTVLGEIALARGDTASAKDLWSQSLDRLLPYYDRLGTPYTAFQIGSIYARLGDVDAALTWLEDAFEGGVTSEANWLQDPALDPVRDRPGFQDLLSRVHQNAEAMRRRVLAAQTGRPVV